MKIKLIGSSLIVAGTALGAGMLAIPMALAEFGLLWSTILMLVIWAGTTYTALLLLEASIKTGGGCGMNSVAAKTLGRGGQLATNCLLYALLVCLLMAYIIGAGDLVQKLAALLGFEVSLRQSQIVFTVVSGLVVAAGTGTIDKLNRLLFAAMMAVLLLILFSLMPNINMEFMFSSNSDDKRALIGTSSVLFTSFGFMAVIPSLVSYNQGAPHKHLRNMIVVGSAIPLVCYLLWLYAVIGNLTIDQMQTFNNVSDLIAALDVNFSGAGTMLSFFTGFALLTSFLGVSMALFDQNSDAFKQNKAVTYMITFILPLIGALLAADHFLAVLGYAGLIMVFLAVFIPMAMTLRLRRDECEKSERSQYLASCYRAGGSNIAMALSFLFGLLLIGAQVV